MTSNGNSLTTETEVISKSETLNLRKRHLASPTSLYFKNDPIKIVRGDKQYLIDENGNSYLDCINNVAHVGHCHPHVTKQACQQISKLYTNSRFLHDTLSLYAERITNYFPAPLDVCFFTNSGSESNDLALTLAQCFTKGRDVITLESAYHGHVRSCLDVSPYKWQNRKREQPDYVHVVSSPSTYRHKFEEGENLGEAYASEVKDCVSKITTSGYKVSAFILESLQSCGGQIIPPEGYMVNAFKHVRDAGGVCIVDEVQCGFGRVGSHFWAFQLQGSDVVPDIVTIGKPMGNGHPLAAVITRKEIADSLTNAMPLYFNTYGGNPVSMAVGMAVLDVIENENLQEKAQKVGKYLLKKLKDLKYKHDIIGDVRGVGLFCGVELVKNKATKEPATNEARFVHESMKDKYILISTDGPFDNVLKFKPPMCFTCDNVDQLVQGLDEVLTDLKSIAA